MSTYLKVLAENLSAEHNVTILTSRYLPGLKRKEVINKVNIIRTPVSLAIGKGVIMFKYAGDVWRQMAKTDVVNCHVPQFESAVVALIAKIFKKKLVVTYHTELSWKGSIFNKISVTIVNFTQLITLLCADVIVTHTKDYVDHSKILKIFRKKITYIMPPVDIKALLKKRESKLFDKFLSKHKTSFKIGFVGRIAKQKGLNYLLNAFPIIKKKLANTVLILVGPHCEVIGEKTYQELLPQINKQKESIFLTGRVDPEEVGNYLKTFDVFVMPSDDTLESMPVAQVEALLFDIPVVVTNLPGVRVAIQKTGMGEIAKVGDSDDLAKKIILVLENVKSYKKNLPKAKELFNINHIIDRYTDVFTSI